MIFGGLLYTPTFTFNWLEKTTGIVNNNSNKYQLFTLKLNILLEYKYCLLENKINLSNLFNY